MYAPLLVQKRFSLILPFKKYYSAALRSGLQSKLGCETRVYVLKYGRTEQLLKKDDELMRVGLGYDIHRLVPGRKLILGGVTIPFDKGLIGHSDADVLVHAVCDALLGAANIQRYFQHKTSCQNPSND